MKIHSVILLPVALLILLTSGCNSQQETTGPEAQTESAMPAVKPSKTADEFVAEVNQRLEELGKENAAAQWVHATYINPDTALVAAKSSERVLAYLSEAVDESKQYQNSTMSEDSARAIKLLKIGNSMPAPRDPSKRAELAQIATRLEGEFGEGKYCPNGPESCQTLEDLAAVMADKKHDYDALLQAWVGWRTIAPKMRDDYTRFVELANEGARELGFADLGVMWKSGYDMDPDQFEQETERLWDQVKPLYNQLHCYVRNRLADYYGEDRVSRNGLIPAHLLGNMWAQEWEEIYDLVEPYPGVAELNVDNELEKRRDDMQRELEQQGKSAADASVAADRQSAVAMVRMAEDFYTSLGMPNLPDSFWERSMLVRPRDREVVCYASAWFMDGKQDVRYKGCIKPTGVELYAAFHELGHLYYDLMYQDQPPLFQDAAHDGFHEAIGDTVNLSMTPEYLHNLGLINQASESDEAVINQQMKLALDKIAFLPFGKLIDMWRWAVFDGRIKKADYNKAWWDLRTKYQGITPPVARSEADFDPGSKYHIPGNTPYTRYFLSFILQFQFHKALCQAAGYSGPLYQCSIYGNKDAGEHFMAMLKLGASRPWQDALEKLTGTRQMDASAIIEYFQPLMDWLQNKNENLTCGW